MRYWNKEQWKQLRRCFGWVGIACAMYLLVSTGCSLGLAKLLEGYRVILGEDTWRMITMLAMYPLAVPICYAVMRKVPKAVQTWRIPLSFGEFIGIFVVSMGFMYIGNLIGQFLMSVVSIITGEPIINDLQEIIMSMKPLTILVVAVVIGPIVEELIFRKFLLDRIAGYGQVTAMLMSGLIFGLAHGNFFQFFYAFAIGVVFAWVYLRTGRIRYTMLLHMMINFCGSLVPLGLLKVMETNAILGSLLAVGQLAMMFGLVVLTIILLVYYRGDIFAVVDRSQLRGGKWFMSAFLNVGMLVFYVVAGAMFFIA